MKKRLKVLLTLLVIIFMTGCSVEYNLVINEDSSINEEIIASEKTKRIESRTKLKGEQATNYLFNMFNRPDTESNFTTTEKNSDTYGTVTISHNSINDFESNFKSDIYENVEITKDDELTTIFAKQTKALVPNSSNSLLYDKVQVSITIPFKVEDHNADKVFGNKYVWIIEKDGKLKNIKISYKDKKIPKRANVEINNKNYSFRYEYIVIIGMVLIIISIVVWVYKNGKKNNRL